MQIIVKNTKEITHQIFQDIEELRSKVETFAKKYSSNKKHEAFEIDNPLTHETNDPLLETIRDNSIKLVEFEEIK